MKRAMLTTLLTSAAAASLTIAAPAAFAQDEPSAGEGDQIIVTGSRIKRQSQIDLPSPLQTVGSEDIAAIGARDISDVTQTLTINTGAQNRPDAFTQNATVGTSNINLRGLGVSSTLVLLNGTRQVSTSTATNDGLQFVDTSSLVPLIAVERVEILKDGASAIYGSDAVAGVVNFITKNDFEGLQVQADYQFQTEFTDSDEFRVQGLWGAQGDRSSIVAAVSYLQREPLYTADRRLSQPANDTSLLGFPASFVPIAGSGSPLDQAGLGGAPIIDPTGCAQFGGFPTPLGPNVPGVGQVGVCGYDFGEFFNLIADETRVQGYFNATYDVTDTISIQSDFGYARNRAQRGNSPSFPALTSPIVPASNPNNPFGEDVVFLGRILGNNATPIVDNANTRTISDTWRFSTKIENSEFLKNGYWEIGFIHGENDFQTITPDTVTDRLQDALNGFGGRDCNIRTGTAGVGPCQYYNPFATSFTTAPNDPDLVDFLRADQVRTSTGNLSVIDAIASTELFDTRGGAAAVAFGFQYREQELRYEFDEISRADGFAFVLGDQDFAGKQDVYALFGEIEIPLGKLGPLGEVLLTGAVRYEDYGGQIGDTVDPKVAVLAQPTDDLSVRASYSQSFRAPSVYQQISSATSLQQVNDPVTGQNVFAAIRAIGNPNLVGEESDAINVGFTWEPRGLFQVNVDYWRFDFTNAIVQENPQSVIAANFDTGTGTFVPGGPVDVNAAGTTSLVRVDFVNASSIETSGVDFSIRSTYDIGPGTFSPSFEGTYILTYDLEDPQAGSIDGAGRRNFTTIGDPTPELRFNVGLNYAVGAFSTNAFVRYIDSYEDDQNTGAEVDSWTSLDLQANLDLGQVLDMEQEVQFSVGATNLTDEEPPFVATNGGFDPRVHDPRGRLVYVRLGVGL